MLSTFRTNEVKDNPRGPLGSIGTGVSVEDCVDPTAASEVGVASSTPAGCGVDVGVFLSVGLGVDETRTSTIFVTSKTWVISVTCWFSAGWIGAADSVPATAVFN